MITASRWYKPLCVGLTIAILAAAAFELYYAVRFGDWADSLGWDLSILTDATHRLFAGESWYLDSQLHGPHPHGGTDILYPPVVAWFFAPFALLGSFGIYAYSGLWAVVMVATLRHWRPAPWAWPVLALCILWPFTMLKVISGNPSLLIAVAVAGATRYRWPAAFVLLKPTFLPLALIGIRTRGWWLTVAALGILSLPWIAETLLYPVVLLNTRGEGIDYFIQDWPLVLLPVLAWRASVPAPDRQIAVVEVRGGPAVPVQPRHP